jgi:hypothetical protein
MPISMWCCVLAIRKYADVKQSLNSFTRNIKTSESATRKTGLAFNAEISPELKMNIVLVLSGCLFAACVFVEATTLWDVLLTFEFDEQPLYALPTWITINLMPGYIAFVGAGLSYGGIKNQIWAKRIINVLTHVEQIEKHVPQSPSSPDAINTRDISVAV